MIWESNQEISAINERKESETDTVVDLPFCVTEAAKDSVAKQPFVLIVSSAPDYRVRLEKTLQRMGCRVVGLQCTSTALSLLEQQRFDVCLLDIHSSKAQVIDMIQQIRHSLTAGGPYIMVLTDPASKSAAAEAIENGADDYIEKPVDERLLQARIRSSLR